MLLQTAPIDVIAFEEFIARPENSDRLFELIDGEIQEKMPNEIHGFSVGRIVTLIGMYLLEHEIGRIGPEINYRPMDDSLNDRLPDISFRKVSADVPLSSETALPGMPDLAIEVKSPSDTYQSMKRTANYYLQNGSQAVWLVYPENKLVEVLTPVDRDLLVPGDMISGGDLLPGLVIPVERIFSLRNAIAD